MSETRTLLNKQIAELLTKFDAKQIVEVFLGDEPSMLAAANQQQQQQQQQKLQ